jgi:hypothetical protein
MVRVRANVSADLRRLARHSLELLACLSPGSFFNLRRSLTASCWRIASRCFGAANQHRIAAVLEQLGWKRQSQSWGGKRFLTKG